ncbi:MAG: 16S rRNA (uracil(1498)-N(3))-methyltransferase [Pseudomonadota bacterium]
MRIPRIFTDQPLASQRQILLESEASHHLSLVLRLQSGAELKLFNGAGEEYAGILVQPNKKHASVDIVELLRTEPDPSLRIHLIIGISRGERMDFALQKAVELGVNSIQPIFTERCVVKLTEKRLTHRMDHWRRVIVNACEQSGRCRIPELRDAEKYATALTKKRQGDALLLDHRSQQTLLDLPQPDGSVTLLVGPEGGLSEDERALAKQQGFMPIKLGPRVLRTETAPLAAIAAIQAMWGDFR